MAVFISKFSGLRVKISSGWAVFKNGRFESENDSQAAELRNAKSFGVDFWEETPTKKGKTAASKADDPEKEG